MIKLLYITNQICGSGGLERVLSIKASALAENTGYEVHIATLNQNKKPFFFEFSNKIKYHDLTLTKGFFSNLKNYIFGLRKIIKSIKPDIILVCDDGFKGFLLPVMLSKPCAMIYERHVSKNISLNENDGFVKKIKTNFVFILMNFFARFYDNFIVLTSGNVQEWNLKNIEVIANPLSFYPKESSVLKNKTVIAVGKQSYQKGYNRLLQSWQIVNKINPDWILKIYGTIDQSQGLTHLAEKLNIQNSVQFFEPDDNIQERFLEASIFVLSSRFEGFGMVIIEAMACGLPVVSFDCPCGPKDIILDGVDGFLVENNNIEQFASKINILIEDENLRVQFAQNGKQNVKRFLINNIIDKWKKLFKKLMK